MTPGNRIRGALCVAAGLVLGAMLASGPRIVGAQQARTIPKREAVPEPPPDRVERPAEPAPADVPEDEVGRVRRDLQGMLPKPDDLKPRPEATIPDDPPPHEGAMIDLPYRVRPPDLIAVEVIEALPGRPITGDRLVRSDGTISLGFYGDLYVRGLTASQIKEKAILHLRTFLTDEALGLIGEEGVFGEVQQRQQAAEPPPGDLPPPPPDAPPGARGRTPRFPQERTGKPGPELPDLFDPGPSPFDIRPPRPDREPPGSSPFDPRVRPTETRQAPPPREPGDVPPPRDSRPARVAVPPPDSRKPATRPGPDPAVPTRSLPAPSRPDPPQRPEDPEPPQEPPAPDEVEAEMRSHRLVAIPPRDSDRVMVDVASYNHDTCYVLGAVIQPGRQPCTGNETVLDALLVAGGLAPDVDAKTLRLVRPARGGKPAKVYPIDLEAIRDRGDVRSNLQGFPGDRIVADRSAAVDATLRLNAEAAPVNTLLNTALTYSFVRRNLDRAAGATDSASPLDVRVTIGGRTVRLSADEPSLPPDPERRKATLRALDDFWKATNPRPTEKETQIREEVRRLLEK